MAFDFPLINGEAYSWSSLRAEIQHGGGVFESPDLQSLDWSDKLTPGAVRGYGSGKRARTRGEYDADAKIAFTLDAATRFLKALATVNKSTGLVKFTIHADWNENGVDHTVEIIGCRIAERTSSNAPGSDATKLEFPLDVMGIKVDGIWLLEPGK